MGELLRTDGVDYLKILEDINNRDIEAGGFPLFPNTNFREYYKYLGGDSYEQYLVTKFKDYDNVVACKISYNRIGSMGIEIVEVVESTSTPNIFLNVLFKYIASEYSHVILPIHKPDKKLLSKIPIFKTANTAIKIIKFDGIGFVDVDVDLISLIHDLSEAELENYKILIKALVDYENI